MWSNCVVGGDRGSWGEESLEQVSWKYKGMELENHTKNFVLNLVGNEEILKFWSREVAWAEVHFGKTFN